MPMSDWKKLVRRNWGWLTAVASAVFTTIVAFCSRGSVIFDIAAKIFNNKAESDRHLDQRFIAASELMAKETKDGAPVIAACVNGILIMQELADSDPGRFGATVIRNMVAYITDNKRKTAIKEEKADKYRFLGNDVKAAFLAIDQLLGKHGKELLGVSDEDLDFSHREFSGLDLSGGQVRGLRHFMWKYVKFEHAYLDGADFRGANLEGAQFVGASLIGVNFRGACLNGVKLWKTQLHGVNFSWADLRYAQLSDIPYGRPSAIYGGTDFSDAEFDSLPASMTDEMHKNVWHTNQSALKEIKQRADYADWGLANEECIAVVIGVLRNFSERDKTDLHKRDREWVRAYQIRKEARCALVAGQLEDLPEDWRIWIMETDPETGRHPRDDRD